MENREFSAIKNHKKPYKFNVMDVFLILIIIIAASVLIYIVAGTGLIFGGEEVSIQYTIDISHIRNEFLPAINRITPGDKITDSIRGYDIGEIHSVKITEATSDTDDKNQGIIRKVPHPDHSRVQITVRAKAKQEGNAKNNYVNGRLIMVGVQMFFRTQHFTGYGNCVELIEITED
jgi:hypothetical protein